MGANPPLACSRFSVPAAYVISFPLSHSPSRLSACAHTGMLGMGVRFPYTHPAMGLASDARTTSTSPHMGANATVSVRHDSTATPGRDFMWKLNRKCGIRDFARNKFEGTACGRGSA